MADVCLGCRSAMYVRKLDIARFARQQALKKTKFCFL